MVRAEVLDSLHAVLAAIGPMPAAPILEICGDVGDARLWDIDDPALYTLRVVLIEDGTELDALSVRFGSVWPDSLPRVFSSMGVESSCVGSTDTKATHM